MAGRCAMVAVLGAAGLLIAACGSSGGSGDVPPPTGPASLASTSAPAEGHATSSRTGAASHIRAAATTHAHGRASATAASSKGDRAPRRGHSSSRPAAHPSSTKAATTCTSSDSAGAAITVCPGRGVHAGQRVRITGAHFQPNEQLLYMQCHYKGENAGDYGMADCNVDFDQATSSDGSGNVGPIYLTLEQSAGNADCTQKQCMVTVAKPLQSGNADNPHALVYFD